ncbi:glycosyltransferase family 2 protein [Caldovatus aquaticus]|uniref:Glycosyltransferase family 2 protein n=1 Tax=Caldovatus aquaticus TaxID=2865671 RepID=A0ABS7F0N8_9PROT|nr:glycosyltransferase family 2 protein [Caldovatus aquaticus]MBW8269190.1 glycosyltransferase family 2 protein [Caldovatus aquaticus]
MPDTASLAPVPAAPAAEAPRPALSVVVPAYNEEAVLDAFHARLAAAMDRIGLPWEVVYVNDGSRDGTLARLLALRAADPRVALVNLSRNFGKEIALTAGLDHAAATDAVVVIDADLQDPPEVIPELVAAWREGYDVVYAQRTARHGEGWFKRLTAAAFYRLMQHVGGRVELPKDTGDFRLMSRRAVDALLRLREQHRFMKGLFAWIGFPSRAVRYERHPRAAGTSKWNYWRLWNLSLEGITSFTVAPLKIATYLGLATSVIALLYGLQVVVKTVLFGNPVAGYPSLMTVVLFLGGVQLMTLGIIGEYLGRVFNEAKQRPLYIVERHLPSGSPAAEAEPPRPPGGAAAAAPVRAAG